MFSLMLLLFLCYKGEEKALNLSTVVRILHTFIMSPVTHLLSKENTQALNFFYVRNVPDSL